MLTTFFSRYLAVIVLIVLPVTIVSFAVFAIVHDCNQRNVTPIILVYPNSQEINQVARDYGTRRQVTITYETVGTFEELLAYFDESIGCNINAATQAATCTNTLSGRLVDYDVYLAQDNRYVVEISWQGCNWEFTMTE